MACLGGTAGPRHLTVLEAMKQLSPVLPKPLSPPTGTPLSIYLQHRHPECHIFRPSWMLKVYAEGTILHTVINMKKNKSYKSLAQEACSWLIHTTIDSWCTQTSDNASTRPLVMFQSRSMPGSRAIGWSVFPAPGQKRLKTSGWAGPLEFHLCKHLRALMLCLAVFHWCVLAAVDNVIGCPCPLIAGTSH